MIVKYSKKFPYAPYLNEDIGFEMEVDVDPNISAEVVLDSLSLLKSIAEKFHKDNNPQLTDGSTVEWSIPISSNIPSLDRKAIERLEKVMDDCTTIMDLEAFRQQAESLGAMGSFNYRMAQIQKITN